MAKHNEIGKIGEEIAVRYLMGKGFSIVCRNFNCKSGEIDIIASKNQKLYFVEVKSKSVASFEDLKYLEKDVFQPENNFSYKKKEKMWKTIKYYLLINKMNLDIDCEISLLVVYVNEKAKQGKVKFYETVILN